MAIAVPMHYALGRHNLVQTTTRENSELISNVISSEKESFALKATTTTDVDFMGFCCLLLIVCAIK